jgi:hypothetical protein
MFAPMSIELKPPSQVLPVARRGLYSIARLQPDDPWVRPRVTDGAARFVARYPVLWHVMEDEGAGCDRLLPAASLRRLAGLPDDPANRDDFQRLTLADGRVAVLRLQQMRDSDLLPTLAGSFTLRPDLWREHIDQHVFFWASDDRRDRFLRAVTRLRSRSRTAPATAPPVLFALDTEVLLQRHAATAFYSVINTGSTVRGGARARRDETTLRPVGLYHGERVAELAIREEVALPGICRPSA